MNILLTIITALTLIIFPASASANTDTTVSAHTAPITAPTVELSYDSPTVSTSPATDTTEQVVIPSIPAPEVGVPTLPRCEEDMECWEGSINDDRVYMTPTPTDTPTSSPEDSAWLSLQSLGDIEVLEDHILEYKGTHRMEPTTTATQFPVMDTETPNVWHVFEYVRVWTA